MLRKRSRSQHKDQNMGHLMSDYSESHSNSDAFLKQKHKTNSFFSVPGLFVGLNPKASESDSVRSPTSPLDFRVFSKPTLGNPFRPAKPSNEGNHKSWDYNKVGLSIIDSLEDETKQSGKVLRSSASKNILFGPQMRVKNPSSRAPFDSLEATNSLPKNYGISPYTNIKPTNSQVLNSPVAFAIGDLPLENEPFGKFCSYSLDSARSGSHLTGLKNVRTKLSPVSSCLQNEQNYSLGSPDSFIGPGKIFVGSLSASEIELSEDYTCVIKHGPNPKTTHIYGDFILECHDDEITNSSKNEEQETALPLVGECSEIPPLYPSDDFLSFCYYCRKKLEGEDIYMYRGEKAFCSYNCRSEEILIEEEMEKANNNSSGDDTLESNNCEELFETSMFVATT